ncbi:hypothetical protein ACODT4_15305 [Streptomyces sp. 2.9]|uniref:ATP-binding protein n=1 Tax=Streptomyces tritrimontium TaxID=3406573 RepID=UPI003BB7023C
MTPSKPLHAATSRPVVLVVAPNDELYRGYCLESVAAAYDTVVITPAALTWEKDLVVDHEVADPYDLQALLAAGEALAARQPVSAVLTWNELLLVNTAVLAQRLQVATDSPDILHGCRDKATSRELFDRHRVPSARSMKAANLLEAALAAVFIGYPVVVKPSGQAGSVGVIRVGRAEELPAGFEFATEGASLWGGESTDVLVTCLNEDSAILSEGERTRVSLTEG